MRYKVFLGMIIIFMLLVTGCMNTAVNTQKIVSTAVQPTVEPPVLSQKSALSVNQLPAIDQEEVMNSSLVTPISTLIYGEFSNTGDSIRFKNIIVNTTINVTPRKSVV